MAAKRWGFLAIVVAVLGGTGCCRFCERWCGPQPQYAPTGCCQPCVPCCPVPAAANPCCSPPGSSPYYAPAVPSQPVAPAAAQSGWNRTYPNQ